jgi:hypothetical protein
MRSWVQITSDAHFVNYVLKSWMLDVEMMIVCGGCSGSDDRLHHHQLYSNAIPD